MNYEIAVNIYVPVTTQAMATLYHINEKGDVGMANRFSKKYGNKG